MNTRILNLTIILSLAVWINMSVNSAAQTTGIAKTEQVSVPNNQNGGGLSLGWVINLMIGLGSGTIGVLITLFFNARIERKRRRAEYLDSQLRNLYGPLQFFTSSSQNIYKHAWKIEQAGEDEYGKNYKKYSDQARSNRIQSTLDVNNEYFALTRSNNKRMVEILTNYYSLIEPEDSETFAEFLTHYLRRETEFDESGSWKLPLELHQHVGDIYSLAPEFGKLVDRRFIEKKAELRRLLR
jgi:hypothetical protein